MAIPGNQVGVMGPWNERLASLPQVPRKVAQGDGSEPQAGNAVATQSQTSVPAEQPQAPTLKDAEPKDKFQTIEQLVRSQDTIARNRWAIDTHFRRIRSGVPFSRLEKIPNQSIWVQKLPMGMTKESSASVPNKADDLCNKIEDTLMSDPPKPNPQPHVEEERAKEAAELAAEFLHMDGGEAGTDDVQTYRWALNNGLTAASSFLHYVVDPTGGGYQPVQKLAHPQAQDPQNPLVAMIQTPEGMVEEQAADPVLRYVSPPTPEAPAGQFVDDAEQADRAWLPAIRIERLRRESVRMFPPTATLKNVRAMVVVRFGTLEEAIKQWPETVGKMSQSDMFGLANWRPVMSDQVVPFTLRGAMQSGATGPGYEQVGTLSALLQRRMFSYRLYVACDPEYPDGYWCDVSGANGGTVLGEGDLSYVVQMPVGGKEKRCRDIPVVQVRPQQDVDGGDPMGWPFIGRFAGPSEAESTLYAAFQDLCDNMLHPHVFLPSTTPVDEDDWLDRTRPIVTDPDAKPPYYEQFPTLPPVMALIDNMDKKMDVISGLTATAQGLDSSNSKSGVAKQLDVRQALVSLSGMQQNLHAAMTRGWRIKCQIAQAEFSTPQMMEYSGDEGSAQPRWWTGENLGGVDRIGIQPGTGTMMTPEGKAQYIAFLQAQQWLPPDEAAKVALPNIKMDLGLPQNPYQQAIERSVATFLQGPSPSFVEAQQKQQQAVQMAQQQYQSAVAQIQAQAPAGTPQVAPPPFQPPPLPPLPGPFTPRPNDIEPKVAAIYAARLSELFVDPQYAKQPPGWQQVAIDAYQRYMQVLMPPPQIPPNVHISEVAPDPQTLVAAEQAASSGKAPPGQPQMPPKAPAPKPAPIPGPAAHLAQRPL